MKFFKTMTLAAACTAAMGVASTANAANWLMLQGTEKAGAAPRAKVWGFIQAQYQKDKSDANPLNNSFVPPKLIGPNLRSQEAFNVNRARIGVRGNNLPLDSKTNYFLLAEFGNNGATVANSSAATLTDASITFNHIDGARVRVGLFKTPGAEEGLQAIHVFDYVNFTWVTEQLLLERMPPSQYTPNNAGNPIEDGIKLSGFTEPVAAFRDTGIQVFDAFRNGDWEHTYAVMYGNGNGLNLTDVDDDKDLYLYWSSEKVFGGKGPRRQGLKFFVWSQDGKRTYDGDNDGANETYDRERSGVGFKYLKGQWRASAEYIKADGMIFLGPDKASFDINGPGAPGSGLNGKASGYYVEGGYYIPNSKWEIDLRYDELDRLEDDVMEMKFTRTTLGAQYHFNKKTRLAINYEAREAEAINFPTVAVPMNPNANLIGVDDRISLQITAIY